MPMRLESRLNRLERGHSSMDCPICHGKGRHSVIELKEFDPVPPIGPDEGCTMCGKVERIYLRWEEENAMGRSIHSAHEHWV
jgi:hypothetical protein